LSSSRSISVNMLPHTVLMGLVCAY
jgi:hypothetical protein